MILLLLVALVLKYRAIFLDGYVYQNLRLSGWDPAIQNAINTVTTVEIVFLICVQSYLLFCFSSSDARRLPAFVFALMLIYFAIKIAIGSRILFVIFLLSIFYAQLARTVVFKRRHFVMTAIFAIPLFVLFNYIRNPDGALLGALLDLGKEFVFASISALYSIDYAIEPTSPSLLQMVSDSVIAVVPSVFFGGASVKEQYLIYEVWKESIGGYTQISPIGGYYLPGQVFLGSNSLLVVFMFFFLYSRLLVKGERLLYTSGNLWSRLVGLQIVTFGVVFGVRTELWILLKMYIQQMVLLTVFIGIAYTLVKQASRSLNNAQCSLDPPEQKSRLDYFKRS